MSRVHAIDCDLDEDCLCSAGAVPPDKEGTQTMDQYLVDYTVRNITTGDEEDIRVLELTNEEIAGFPDDVRDDIRTLIEAGIANSQDWHSTHQETIRRLLLPYISRPELYEADYEAWERYVLGDEEEVSA